MNLRNTLEILIRGIVLRRKMPARFGARPIFVSPEGGLRYWRGELNKIDPMLLMFADKYIKPTDIVWDIGANVGFFTMAAAHKIGELGEIYSFEPDVFLCNILKKTQLANSDKNINVFPFAISNEFGVSTFNVAKRSRSTNF